MATFVQWHFQPAEDCNLTCKKLIRRKILEKIKKNSNLQDTVEFNFILGKIKAESLKAESQDLGKCADVYTTWKRDISSNENTDFDFIAEFLNRTRINWDDLIDLGRKINDPETIPSASFMDYRKKHASGKKNESGCSTKVNTLNENDFYFPEDGAKQSILDILLKIEDSHTGEDSHIGDIPKIVELIWRTELNRESPFSTNFYIKHSVNIIPATIYIILLFIKKITV